MMVDHAACSAWSYTYNFMCQNNQIPVVNTSVIMCSLKYYRFIFDRYNMRFAPFTVMGGTFPHLSIASGLVFPEVCVPTMAHQHVSLFGQLEGHWKIKYIIVFICDYC